MQQLPMQTTVCSTGNTPPLTITVASAVTAAESSPYDDGDDNGQPPDTNSARDTIELLPDDNGVTVPRPFGSSIFEIAEYEDAMAKKRVSVGIDVQIWDPNATFSSNQVKEVHPVACIDGEMINVHVPANEALNDGTIIVHNKWNVNAHNVTGFTINSNEWKFRTCGNTWTQTSSNGIMTWKEFSRDANVIYLLDTNGRNNDTARIDLNNEQGFYCSMDDCYSFGYVTDVEVRDENNTIDTEIWGSAVSNNVKVPADEVVENKWNLSADRWEHDVCGNQWTEITNTNRRYTWQEYSRTANSVFLLDTNGRDGDTAQINLSAEEILYCTTGDCFSIGSIASIQNLSQFSGVDSNIRLLNVISAPYDDIIFVDNQWGLHAKEVASLVEVNGNRWISSNCNKQWVEITTDKGNITWEENSCDCNSIYLGFGNDVSIRIDLFLKQIMLCDAYHKNCSPSGSIETVQVWAKIYNN